MLVLPASPGPVSLEWAQIDFGGTLSGPLGASDQRLNRLGNRMSVRVELPRMTPQVAGIWIFALNKGLREGVRWNVRQVEITTTGFGTPVVNGGGQSGEALTLRGMTAGKTMPYGQMFTLESAGIRYLHLGAGTANGSGAVTLTLAPPLRTSPADGDSIIIDPPTIDGLLDDESARWTVDRARRVGLGFTIREQD